jgi:hypothetical protein
MIKEIYEEVRSFQNKIFYYNKKTLLKIFIYRATLILIVKLRYLIFIIFFYSEIKKITRLKNTKKGFSAFVFANGPSLNKLNKKKIEKLKFDIFAINRYVDGNFPAPNFYVLSDPSYFKRDKRCPQNLKIFNKLKNKNVNLFIPSKFLKFVSFKSRICFSNIFSFCDIENKVSTNINPILPRGYVSLTGFKALAIALYMGYSKIYISGFDNSNMTTGIKSGVNNNLDLYVKHFYKEDRLIRVNLLKQFSNIGMMYYCDHAVFQDFAMFISKKTKIFNLDKESLITFFSKKHNLDI